MNEKFAQKLATLRAKKGLTQRELGAMVGIAWSMISKYESGQSLPRLKVLMRLAEALGVTVDELRASIAEAKNDIRIYEGFSSRLVVARSSAGLSKKKLAELAGIDQETLTEFELGSLFPSPDDVINLSQALGMEVSALAGTKDEAETLLLDFREPGEKDSIKLKGLVAVDPASYENFLKIADRFGATAGELMSAMIFRESALLDQPPEDVPSIVEYIEKIKSGAL